MKRLITFIKRVIQFRSISTAFWLDAYDNYTPTHGGK